MRPNLLDNAIFVGGGTAGNLPVNQIGETTYTYEFPGYVFDRWKIRDDQTIIEFEDDCIVVKNGKSFDGAVIAFGQTLEKSLSNIDSDITISCFVKEMQGDWYIACNSINSSDTKLTIGITEKYFPIETVNQDGKELYLFKNSQGENDYIKIKAIKIEQGKNQSLAYADENNIYLLPQPDSDYATQLAKCQRYLYKIAGHYSSTANIIGTGYMGNSTQARIFIPLPTTMSLCGTTIKPTIEFGGNLTLRCGSANTDYPVTDITPQWEVTPHGINVFCTVESNASANDNAILRLNGENSYLLIDATL